MTCLKAERNTLHAYDGFTEAEQIKFGPNSGTHLMKNCVTLSNFSGQFNYIGFARDEEIPAPARG